MKGLISTATESHHDNNYCPWIEQEVQQVIYGIKNKFQG